MAVLLSDVAHIPDISGNHPTKGKGSEHLRMRPKACKRGVREGRRGPHLSPPRSSRTPRWTVSFRGVIIPVDCGNPHLLAVRSACVRRSPQSTCYAGLLRDDRI